MIYLGSDHGGFALKQKLAKHLQTKKIKFQDLGPFELNLSDDYPDFAKLVADKVAKNPEAHIGILLCRSGQGMCIAANKVKGIRAASAWNKKLAVSTRSEDMANVLCLASDHLSSTIALSIADIFIRTPFSKGSRHGRRVNKIKRME